jgi:hypothetical protein
VKGLLSNPALANVTTRDLSAIEETTALTRGLAVSAVQLLA